MAAPQDVTGGVFNSGSAVLNEVRSNPSLSSWEFCSSFSLPSSFPLPAGMSFKLNVAIPVGVEAVLVCQPARNAKYIKNARESRSLVKTSASCSATAHERK